MNYKHLSDELTKLLGLPQPAVGVKLIKDDFIPEGWERGDKQTFCQFIMMAREGGRLIADAENISCPNGASALGFIDVPEKLTTGALLETIGAFQQEAGAEAVASIPRFNRDEFTRIALAPLAQVSWDPDVVMLETLPEHVMWLNLASIYSGGGRLNFSTSVSNGTCSDLTVVPQRSGQINISAGCYGCRNATSVPPEYMYASFPGKRLEGIVDALQKINEKAMPRTRSKKAYKRLISV
ncbi:MAG: DUF169 domain-containing protein [Spirochaetales bacterium]|nr:DUF169 domain-containing protein [Spirochaetales bacterium]